MFSNILQVIIRVLGKKPDLAGRKHLKQSPLILIPGTSSLRQLSPHEWLYLILRGEYKYKYKSTYKHKHKYKYIETTLSA